MQLREHQVHMANGIEQAWASGHQNVLATMPTGGGKTPVFSHILHQHMTEPSCAIAHRKELVGQISMALARFGVRHRVIGPPELVKYVIRRQQQKLGRDFYQPNAQCAVAAVDTLIRRKNELKQWLPQVRRWVLDEGHHLLQGNKWGTAVDMFPNSLGLGVTATACRADGKGLGRETDGLYDHLVRGPSGRVLINAGWLSDYDLVCPTSDLVVDEAPGGSGDWSHLQLRRAAKRSHIVGDAVTAWLKYAGGRRTILFAPDVETGVDLAERFRKAGVRAEFVSGESPTDIRNEVCDRFERGELDVLINVDLFGEGFDVPAVEVVQMCRPTQSFGLYSQMFGRALRILPGVYKLARIIDMVGNVERHGLPDRDLIWTLDAREKRPRSQNSDDDIPMRVCVGCAKPYERYRVGCPYCGLLFAPAARSTVEEVDGDLGVLTPEMCAVLRGELDKVNMSPAAVMRKMQHAGVAEYVVRVAGSRIAEKQLAQEALRRCMEWWGFYQTQRGLQPREVQKLFYLMFQCDVITAQTLGRAEALALAEKINREILRYA